MFNLAISLVYVLAILFLLWEARGIPARKRKELQTIPLMLAVTTLYGVLLWKVNTLLIAFWTP